MPKTRKQKEKIIKELEETLTKAKIVLFTDHYGLSANELNELRSKLRENNCKYQVIKKTLLCKVVNDNLKQKVEELQGGLGLVFGLEDEIVPVKIASKFAKEKQNFKVLGGIWGNEYLGEQDAADLAKLPSKQELTALFVGGLKAPLTRFVGDLKSNLVKLVYILDSLTKK